MKTFFIATGSAILGVVLGTLLLVFAGGLLLSGFAANVSRPAPLADSMVLELDLRTALPDQAPTSGLNVLLGTPESFIDTILKIEGAAEDERVKGIFIRGSEFGVGSARSEELRDALKTFQDADKFVVAHIQGSYGGGPSAYRSIASADEIWIQPGADLIATGVGFETMFLRGLFDNLGVTPDIQGFYEYKSAASTYIETDYTEPHRESLTELASGLWEAALSDIAEDRALSVEFVRTTLESGPLSAEVMIANDLAQETGWPEDARGAALERAGETAELTYIGSYKAPEPAFGAPTIAVVGAQGAVVTGSSGGSLLSEGQGFASDTIAGALLDAGQDESVSAIVFRIDSPGGSPAASDQIWGAVKRVQDEYNKPVVVSMASTAASGGYYAAAAAEWIVANRSTITGSIGIVGGKIGISEGLARIGVNAKSILIGGEFTGAVSTTAPFTPEQRQLYGEFLKRGYDRFVEVVAEGRKMSIEDTHERARGRVWSGQDAFENGLVDQLGGISTAIAKAKELSEIEAETDVRILFYPLAPEGITIGGPSLVSSASDLQALGKLNDVLSDPAVEAVLMELKAAQSSTMQARIPNYNER